MMTKLPLAKSAQPFKMTLEAAVFDWRSMRVQFAFGFAITLILGLVINLFTAIIVTHTFMNLIMRVVSPSLRESALFTGIRKTKE